MDGQDGHKSKGFWGNLLRKGGVADRPKAISKPRDTISADDANVKYRHQEKIAQLAVKRRTKAGHANLALRAPLPQQMSKASADGHPSRAPAAQEENPGHTRLRHRSRNGRSAECLAARNSPRVKPRS